MSQLNVTRSLMAHQSSGTRKAPRALPNTRTYTADDTIKARLSRTPGPAPVYVPRPYVNGDVTVVAGVGAAYFPTNSRVAEGNGITVTIKGV